MLGDLFKTIAGPVVGGLFGLKGESDREDSVAQQQAQNTALQREFAQNGIRWKVEDAKAAGLHPLYALGGAGAAYAPNPVVVGDSGKAMADMGQNVTRALMAQQTAEERELGQLRLAAQRAAIAKDESQAAYYNSLAAKADQERVGSAPFPSFPTTPRGPIIVEQGRDHWSEVPGEYGITGPRSLSPFGPTGGSGRSSRGSSRGVPVEGITPAGRIDPKPQDQYFVARGDSSRGAATNPFWGEYTLNDRPGRTPVRVQLPFTEEGPGESMENVPWYMWPYVVGHNMRTYGYRWPIDVMTGGASIRHRPGASRPAGLK